MAQFFRRMCAAGFWIAVAVALWGEPAHAQQSTPVEAAISGKTLKVATRRVPPFVLAKDNGFSGFSIDLLAALAETTGTKTELAEVTTLPDLLVSVADHKVDFAIAAISITSQREQSFDFSQPMFDSGLQILVRSNGDSGGFTLGNAVRVATSGPMLDLLIVLGSIIAVAAHIVWLFDRHHDEAVRPYFPGIFRSVYWATGAAGGQQPFHPHSAIGRVVGALCVFLSIIIVAYFTATVTSSMTVEQLKNDINGPDDLPGKKVGSVAGSTSAAYLQHARLNPTEYGQIAGALDALLAKEVDAVVFDSPVLLYFAANDGKGKVTVTGPVFKREAYGILYPFGSPLRKPLDAALLRLRESGAYDAIYRKWFGAAQIGG